MRTSYCVARTELPLLTATTPTTLAVIIDTWNTVRVLLGTRRLALPLDRSFHVYNFQSLDWDFRTPNFGVTPDSPPRKVMLSEIERHMILQQSQQKQAKSQPQQGRERAFSWVSERVFGRTSPWNSKLTPPQRLVMSAVTLVCSGFTVQDPIELQ